MRTGWITRARVLAPVLLVAACSATPPPVPVLGAPGDVSALAGEWIGEYWSVESGRSGSILFRLQAGADTAAGDVLMIPSNRPHTHAGGQHPTSEFLNIRFVRVRGTSVRGMLEPYRDPDCGCQLETAFDGEMRADTITGTYVSRHSGGGQDQRGNWRVVRHAIAR